MVGPRPPFPTQSQAAPGSTAALHPAADHGEHSYRGHDLFTGCAVLVTGGDSGIGRAVALAFAREGADVLIAYLNEHADAKASAQLVEAAGRRALTVAGDVTDPVHCRRLVAMAQDAFGRLDVLVNNAAFQRTHQKLDEFPDADVRQTFSTNIESMFYLSTAAAKIMKPGSSIINTTSIQADDPSPSLLAYAASKAAIANFTAGLGQLLAKDGIRVNAVAPGPVWTPLIPSTMPAHEVSQFGAKTPLAPGAAGGTRTGLRVPGLRSGELHRRGRAARDRGPAFPLTAARRGDATAMIPG